MGIISRGIKNAFRNGIRTTSIIFILAVSVSMALVMLMAMKTVQQKIASVKSSIGNSITVAPAGVRGFEGGGTLLTDQNATDIKAMAHVTGVVETITDRMQTTQDTNLASPVTPGSFGNRQAQRTQSQYGESSSGRQSASGQAPANFTMPIQMIGTSDLNSLAALNASSFNITAGAKFDTSSSANVAMVGKDVATKNSLSTGSTFTAYGQTVTVSGIFDAGNTFANAMILMPLKTAQTLSSQTGQTNSIIVQTDSIDSVSSVQSAIKTKLGDAADVTSAQDTSNEAIAPLQNIKTISMYSLIGSLVAGAIIIFLTMLMIVRERRREIGVLKAIGSSNVGIVVMFMTESLVLTLISSIIGAIAGLIFSNPILNVLVTNSESASNSAMMNNPNHDHGAMIARFAQAGAGVQNAMRNLHAVVGWDLLLYGLAAAIAIAIIGSAVPSFFIAKIRPAEVMRAD